MAPEHFDQDTHESAQRTALSWRDVGSMVNESEVKVLAAINTLDERMVRVTGEVETRAIEAVRITAARIDANRATDLLAVGLANARAELTTAALAEKVADSAKTLATQVEATAKAAAVAVEATAVALGIRIKPLEDARYEAAGRKTGITDSAKVFYAGFGAAVPIILYVVSGMAK